MLMATGCVVINNEPDTSICLHVYIFFGVRVHVFDSINCRSNACPMGSASVFVCGEL